MTKKAARHPNRAAICVVNIGASASPARALALTTIPMLRPRLFGSEDASIIDVIVGHVGPSAMPIRVRIVSSSAKDRAIPESQENTENRKTVGIRTGRRPIRSETAPKIKPDPARASAKADANSPTCA